MTDTRKVPEIRFKGFDGEWEEKRLGEISESYSGGTPTVGHSEYYGGKIPFIRSAEINSGCTELFITQEGLANSSAKMVSTGDILYALYGATSGEVGRSRLAGAINQAILAIKTKDNYDAEFITQWLRKQKGFIVSTYLQGGQGNLSGTIAKDFSLLCSCFSEQSKIGTFFQNLDSLITLHQRKYDKLTTVKKAMLEKMFPKEVADLPEIRFKGFTDKWERRTLGEIVTEIRRPIELKDEQEYELVTVKRRNEGVVSRGKLKGKAVLVKNYFELRSGDYLISKRQIVHGANGVVPESLDRAIVSNEYLVAISNERITTDFFALFSKLPNMYKKFFLSSYGIDIEKLVFDVEDWKKRDVVVPGLAEQQRISSFFRNLDSLITLQQRELDKLKNIKKACLEKMFV
jgi:type I restriction enzyme S subunit